MTIDRKLRSITEDRRADYCFDTKTASEAVGCVPNKFGDWWRRTRGKLVQLHQAQPAALAAEYAALVADAERERERRKERKA